MELYDQYQRREVRQAQMLPAVREIAQKQIEQRAQVAQLEAGLTARLTSPARGWRRCNRLTEKDYCMETKTSEETKKPETKSFWGRIIKPPPASKSADKKRERRARYSRVHVITGKAGDVVTIGGTRYKIAPAGNLVKVQ